MKTRYNISFAVFVGLLMTVISGFSQTSITNDGTLPDVSAMLDVKSTTRGVLFPRMTQAQKLAIANPAAGLTLYQTDGVSGLYYNAGSTASPLWLLVGTNAGQWQNTSGGIYYNAGNVGIGVSNPFYKFELDGFAQLKNTGLFPFLFMDIDAGLTMGRGGLRITHGGLWRGYIYYDNQDSILRLNTDFNGGWRNDLTIKYNGNVGVGTPDPLALFHVERIMPGITASFGNDIALWNTSTNVNIGDTSGPAILYIGKSKTSKGAIYWSPRTNPSLSSLIIGSMYGVNPVALQAEGAEGGKVGIGLTNPEGTFHVKKHPYANTAIFGSNISTFNTGVNVSIGDTATSSIIYIGQSPVHKGFIGWMYNANPNYSYFSIAAYAGGHPLVLQEAGNVGIGTTAPSAKLEVDYGADSKMYFGYSSQNSVYLNKFERPENGDGQSVMYSVRDRSSQNDGYNYGFYGSNTASKSYSFWGDLYSFGASGFNYNDFTRCGGSIGAEVNGFYWGALGYKNSGGTSYGGYFTSSVSGTGKSPGTSIGIGIGAWGDLMGADIHGKVYGVYAEGQDYALYSNGPVYKNNLDVHLQKDVTGNNTVLYTNVSTDATIQTCGQAIISGGQATIAFDPAFAAAVSSETPVIVTVTPTGNSNGIYLAEVTKTGFKVAENNDGKSNLTINYIAIGKRAGYEHPVLATEVVNSSYTEKLSKGLHNDADLQTNGQGLYYQGGNLTAGVHPSTLPDPNKPSAELSMPKPMQEPARDPSKRPVCIGSGGYSEPQQAATVQNNYPDSPISRNHLNNKPSSPKQQPVKPGAQDATMTGKPVLKP